MRLIIMFIAIALAAGVFFIAMHFTAPPPLPVVVPQAQVKEAPTVDVYTAKRDIPVGTIMDQGLLDLQPWPRNLVLPDMVVAEYPHPGDIIRMITRTPFSKGEPIMISKLANQNDPSFLAASLGEGMRLVTIAVDAVSGGGGFLFPGDRVDILLTHEVPVRAVLLPEGEGEGTDAAPSLSGGHVKVNNTVDSVKAAGQAGAGVLNAAAKGLAGAAAGGRNAAAGGSKQTTELLVPNVRVLAANQKSTARGGDALVVPSTVSLEVSLVDAQKIRLVENGNGRMSLALRSLKEKDSADSVVVPSVVSDLSAFREATGAGVSQVTVVRGVRSESVDVSKP